MTAGGPLLCLRAVGHPRVTATHAKTLELTTAPTVTGRASCVIGVGAQVLTPGEVGLAGPVLVEITAGSQRVRVAAVANPDWRPGEPVVLRRSANRLRGTLATDATLSAAELPRDFVARAVDPHTEIEVQVHRLARRPDGRAGLVLLWARPAGPQPRLLVEAAAADLVLAEDQAAGELLADLGVAAVDASTGGPAAVDGVTAGRTNRVLVVSTDDLPGASVRDLLARPDLVAVEVAGLPPGLVAAAASPRRADVHLVGHKRLHDIDPLLRSVPAGSQLVVAVPAARLSDLLARAADTRGTATAVVVDPVEGGVARWGPVEAARVTRRSGTVVCCLDGTDRAPHRDEPVTWLVGALLAGGVSARTVALALAGLPGWSRRSAYEAVNQVRAGMRKEPPRHDRPDPHDASTRA